MRASFLFSCVLCAACAINPVTKSPEIAMISESREVEMGYEVDRELFAAHRVFEDMAWQRYVQQIGLRLVAQCERPGLPWKFRVLDDTSLNAFAAPGGFVYVTRRLLVYLNSEAQLAAVLGHEIGHITARHAVGQITRRQLGGLGLAVASAATAWPVGYAGARGLEALFLKNSRHDEQQADDLGLHYMSDAGYDPAEMVGVLRMLDQAVGGGPPHSWQATHPSPEHRLENIALERFTLRSNGTLVERDAYVRRLDGFVVGVYAARTRRRGNVKGNQPYQFTFPDGWTVRSDSGAARGENPGHDAAIEITTVDQPNADSAARAFFTLRAKATGRLTPAIVNDLAVVSAPFSLLPLSAKTRGYVSFIEYEGAVYRVMGYAMDKQWPVYRGRVEGAMRSFEAIASTDSAVPPLQSLRLAIVSLDKPITLAALVKARPAPVEPAELALMNQVPSDSLLPAGWLVKWVVGAAER